MTVYLYHYRAISGRLLPVVFKGEIVDLLAAYAGSLTPLDGEIVDVAAVGPKLVADELLARLAGTPDSEIGLRHNLIHAVRDLIEVFPPNGA